MGEPGQAKSCLGWVTWGVRTPKVALDRVTEGVRTATLGLDRVSCLSELWKQMETSRKPDQGEVKVYASGQPYD